MFVLLVCCSVEFEFVRLRFVVSSFVSFCVCVFGSFSVLSSSLVWGPSENRFASGSYPSRSERLREDFDLGGSSLTEYRLSFHKARMALSHVRDLTPCFKVKQTPLLVED